MLKITIAGASGYVGSYLVETLAQHHHVTALSRSEKKSHHKNITWRKVDLFSFNSTNLALEDTDIAIYLVHSMLPATRLFQGSFYDTDLMLADNFAHACQKNNVKQIIYLSGVIPQGETSSHLESRKEVEDVFFSSNTPVTVLRAGLVVGNSGSSFEILKNLAHNLPAMILPKWTQSLTQIIYIDDLIRIISKTIKNQDYFNKVFNITNGEKIKYADLIKQTVKHIGKKPLMLPVPIHSTSFSKLWVTLFGQSQYELVSPLVDSLTCDFSKIKPDELIKPHIQYPSFAQMLTKIKREKIVRQKHFRGLKKNNVTSIQRLPSKIDFSITKIAQIYLDWIPTYTNFIIQVKKKDDLVKFYLIGFFPLLALKYVPDSTMKERAKFHVKGGLLTQTKETGWLEFRNVVRGKFLLTSINEFYPSLPWYLYKLTQAPLHKYVMTKFGAYLEKLDNRPEK